MAKTGKNSPLGVNIVGSILNHTGLTINKVAASYMGASKTNASYTFGTVVSETCLRLLTWAINDGYRRGIIAGTTLTDATYNNIIAIGANTVPALGNAKPDSYIPLDPSNIWARPSVDSTDLCVAEKYALQHAAEGDYSANDILPGPATSGYGNSFDDPLQGYGLIDQQQNATWYPYNTTNINNSITQWGWVRCHALQAWNEFNWNADFVTREFPEYNDFCSSFITCDSFVNYNNQAIISSHNANRFLKRTYSNMDDLVTGDISGISLSSIDFGADLIKLGKAFNTNKVDAFGLPSTLLATLGTNNAITQDLSLALLAAGLQSDEITNLSAGTVRATKEQEQKIYGAFLIITGNNLVQVLEPLQCVTEGLTSLADLLNVKKMFPNSYMTLTVPKYNAEPNPTNSKTYYLIYINDSVNPALDTSDMREYAGLQVPKGIPNTFNDRPVTDPNNYGELPIGFGAYARGIIPDDQALAAGALSFTMRQVRKIDSVDFKKFAKVAQGMENMNGLPLTAGTDKPTSQTAIDTNRIKGALGSGPYGSYTLSDLFGCMSGLPYPWQLIEGSILELQTDKLKNIYRELFLATTWDKAAVTVQYSTSVIDGTTYYQVTGVTIANSGGGYGRGTAPPPNVVLSNGGTVAVQIGTDDSNAGSVGQGTFGRVVSLTLTNPGPAITSIPTATIQAPPTANLPVSASGEVATNGTNTAPGTTGWASPMNAVVQAYIDQANAEIVEIQQRVPDGTETLNAYWNILGSQLVIEQRARYLAMSPVPVPKDWFLNPYHLSLYNFVDSIPFLSQDTRPHMSAQTIEAICDLDTEGGQSTVGAMRQERNTNRLLEIGIDLDNNILDTLSDKEIKLLTTNGTLPGAIEGTGIPYGDTDIEYTIPSWPNNEIDGTLVEPNPLGVFDPAGFTGTFLPINTVVRGTIDPILQGRPNPTVSTTAPAGTTLTIPPRTPLIVPPAELDPTNLPPNLNPNYIASTLLPSSPNIPNAIDQVIACNCDCWVD